MRCTVWLGTHSFADPRLSPITAGPFRDGAVAAPAGGIKARIAPPTRLWPILLAVLLALVAAALTPASALAGSKQWAGLGGDASWSTPGNWIGGALVDDDDVVFPIGSSAVMNNDFVGLRW